MNDVPSSIGQRAWMLARGGDMGARVAAFDWAASPLGPMEDWPAALVNAVAVLLPASAEIVLFWGPDYIPIYNDAYAGTIGLKHPRALGRPARESWGELWSDREVLLARVRATGETYSAKDQCFDIERKEYREEVFFDLSYSAVPVEDGSVGGVMCIVSETTERVRAARAVAEDRARLHEMFDRAPSFMAVLRVPGYIFELANASYRELMGEADLIGRSLKQALPELAQQGFTDMLDSVVRTGRTYRGMDIPVTLRRGRSGGGEERWLDFIYQPIRDAHGAVKAVFVEGVDLTERHRIESALAVSRRSLELATRAGEIGIWDIDLVADTVEWSERAKTMFGLPPGQVIDRPLFYERMHPDDRDVVRASFRAVIDPARQAPFDHEYRTIMPDGTVRWIAVKGRGVFEGGVCVRAVGTMIDVTRRRVEGEALRESEERFRTLADGLPALVWMTDTRGKVIFANEGFRSLLDIAPEQILAHGWAPLLRPADRARVRNSSAARLANPAVFGGDFGVVTPTGAERWIHGEVRPRYAGGTFIGYVACAVDVTTAHLAGAELEARVTERTAELTRQIAERERVEETLHQMQRLEAVGQLTSGVAHDFNNLLTVVLGNVDMLGHAARRGPLDERALRRLDHVRTAAERGATLTAQLLAFSRRQRLETRVVDLNETVAGLSELLGSTLGRSIAITTRLADGLWPALVDVTQIELIILNLAVNARDAMPGGGVLTVSTGNVSRGEPERAEEPPAGDYVDVAVTDTGTGMTDAVLARAFEPFFTTKEVGKGSGLGLAQAFGFAKQSGGGVRIDSQLGKGTTVHVFLPRAKSSVAAMPLTAREGSAPSAAAVPTSAICGRKILVLDDEDAVREIAAEALREAGCRVVEAADGGAALRALAQEPGIEAVVADVAMPGMTGVEFARRARRRWPGLPILFVTGYADIAAIADVPEDRIVRKPYARDALVARVRQTLERG